jgi:hypothetical protein
MACAATLLHVLLCVAFYSHAPAVVGRVQVVCGLPEVPAEEALQACKLATRLRQS